MFRASVHPKHLTPRVCNKNQSVNVCVDKIAGCSEIHNKFSSALCKQQAEFVKFKFGGAFSNQ